MPKTLYLIDAFAQIFRAYYAIRVPMHSPVTSEPTHAVFGFTSMLLKLFGQFHPEYVVVATDRPGKTFRDDLSDTYKGTRRATPEDLTAQIPRIFELIELFGIPLLSHEGMEADDVIASIVKRVLNDPACNDVNIRIVSKDKDLEQLLGDRVSMFDIHTDTTIDVAGLKASKGVTPEQVVDLLALTGDTVDNVRGVEGIGPKTAAQLLQEFGSIDGIYANLDKIQGKKRENLEKAKEYLPVSRQLVTLHADADIGFSLEDAKLSPIHLPKVLGVFEQLGFRQRLPDEVKRLAAASPGVEPPEEPAPEVVKGQTTLELPTSDEPVTTASNGDYKAITTAQELEELTQTLRAQPMISVDTETTGLSRNAHLCGLSFAWTAGSGVYVPIRSPEQSSHLDEATVIKALGPLLEDPALPKCGHNIKFDAHVLLRSGVHLRGVQFDSMLAQALIDPSQGTAKLDNLALSILRHKMIPITDLIGDGPEQAGMDTVPLAKIVPYAAEDADVALQLYQTLSPTLDGNGMTALMRDIEAPLTTVIALMETNGILCDPDELIRQGEALGARVEALRAEIREAAGCDFDLNSTKQLAEVLFDKLGLKEGKKTKTGRSTDVEVLEKLAAEEDRNDPRTGVPRLILEYRQLTKLIGTYLGNLRQSIDPVTKRIHSTFHQLVTATGRIASHGPNLQNIPVRTDIGRQIRKAFYAPEGSCLICADYSQIELRVLAHLSGDAALIDAFEKGLDIHTAVASQVFGVPTSEVTRAQRDQAKTINFGIIYGVTAWGLARRIEGLDQSSASKLISDYKATYPGIDTFLRQCVQNARTDGYVSTIMGRRRNIPEVSSPVPHLRSLGERLAINSVVQGSAADLIKSAMVKVQARIDREDLPVKMLLQIHDELVFETPMEGAGQRAEVIRHEMENAMTLTVPLKVDCGIGRDWMSAK